MNPLHPRDASGRLSSLGRLLFDTEARTLWERDTETLPAPFRTLRRHYRAFAEEHLAPRALAADRDPHGVDGRALFLAAARHGLETELLPPPFGTMPPRALTYGLVFAAALKAEELSSACAGLALVLLGHDLGIAPLFLSGDPRALLGWQRRIYREIRRGEPALAAFAITEPGAGSDAEETEGAARARVSATYRAVPGGYLLNGRKCFISNGAIARWVTLFAAPEGGGFSDWTCFLLDESLAGLSRGRSERKLGQRASDATELLLESVFVPEERRIGPLGGGWAISRNVLNYSRPCVGAIAVGIARGALAHAVTFCRETMLSGRSLLAYPEVQLRLAELLTQVQAARALVWQAARYRRPFQTAGSMAKTFASDTAWAVSSAALELLGEHGYLPGHGVEKAARDARLTQIYEGTNQINRLAIFEGQLGAEF